MAAHPQIASYDPVAAFYDQHWGYEFSIVAKAAFEDSLLPLLPPGASVLDLCCGTGLILAHLQHLGFQATGVDESSRMLAIARTNAPCARLEHADMAAFQSGARFHAVVSFYNSLNHARSFEHLRATLVNVADHLLHGGFLLFDYVLPEAFETSWEWCEQFAAPDRARTFRYTYEQASGQATCQIDQQDTIRQISFAPAQLCQALSDAGLDVMYETIMTGAALDGGRRLLLARRA